MSLFEGTRKWIYTRHVEGKYQQLHRWSGRLLVGALFVAPWVSFGGQPMVRVDLPGRRIQLLGQLFTASDGYLIVLIALLAAFLLFFVSAVWGRLWCGYLCPQTVFLEEWVRRVEDFIEGDGRVRARRDKAPWTFDRAWRYAAKVGVLSGMALALGMTVLSYFEGPWAMWMGTGSSTAYSLVGIIVVTALADWLWFREQLCIYLCPYARFQSSLTDEHSLMVAFKPDIAISKGKQAVINGDCIDCKKCVTVCPMGIDIRDGFQLECINCARCVDACTNVMEPLGRETLVRYTTLAADMGQETQTYRPRVMIYGAIITGLTVAILLLTIGHNPIEVTVNRMPGSLYVMDDDGMVRNTFLLKVVNNDPRESHAYRVSAEGVEGLQMSMPPLVLEPGEDRVIPLTVRLPESEATTTRDLTITVHGEEGNRAVETTFVGPTGAGS